jgi:hypothetical protein
MIQKFRQKPAIIEVVQFTRNNFDEVRAFTNGKACNFTTERRIDGVCTCQLSTPLGIYIVSENSFIAKREEGDFCAYKPDIFAAKYELVG